MEKENELILREIFMKESFQIHSRMAKERLDMKIKIIIKVIDSQAKRKDMELLNLKITVFMKVFSKTESLTIMVNTSNKMEVSIKGNDLMEKGMEEGFYYTQVAINLKEILLMIKEVDKESQQKLMVLYIKGIDKKINLMEKL